MKLVFSHVNMDKKDIEKLIIESVESSTGRKVVSLQPIMDESNIHGSIISKPKFSGYKITFDNNQI